MFLSTIGYNHGCNSRMAERELTELLEAELPLKPSAAGKEGSFSEEASRTDEKERSTSAAQRFLTAEIDRLVEENQELKQFRDKYHDVDKKLAVLKEALKPFRTNELLSSVCLAIGSAGLGAAPSFVSLSSYGWYVFLIVSALLVFVGIAARVRN